MGLYLMLVDILLYNFGSLILVGVFGFFGFLFLFIRKVFINGLILGLEFGK